MFRNLIALVIAFAIAFTGIVEPAHAYPDNSGVMPAISHGFIEGNGNTVNINDSFNSNNGRTEELSSSVGDAITDGMIKTLGGVIGGAVICYVIDSAATMFFPPAVALAPFCAAIGATSGGARLVTAGR